MWKFSSLPSDLVEGSNDLRIYRDAGEAILRGEVPYRDFFAEYPPGSFPAFVGPALFSQSARSYQTLFAHEMTLVLVASLVLTALFARKVWEFGAWAVPSVAFVAGALMLYPVAVTRYDALVALTLAAAALLATMGKGATLLAYAALGFGAAAKLIPALAALPLALLRRDDDAESSRNPARGAGSGLAVFFAVAAVFFAPAYALGGAGFLESFAYHAGRGLQLESVGASALLNLGWVESVVFEHGAFEVRGRGADLLVSLSPFVTGTLFAITGLAILREHRRGSLSPELFPRYALALILAFMLGSKVLSPQYMIWLLPLAPLSVRGLAGAGFSALFLAACWMTTQVFPVHYADLFDAEFPGTQLLLARNALLALLWAALLLPAKASNSNGKDGA